MPDAYPLEELNGRFLKVESETSFRDVDTNAEADGIIFLCPKCFHANGGPRGTHSVICWKPNVNPEMHPKPGRWNMEGELKNLTFVGPGAVSVLLTGGCNWHGFIRDGKATLF